MRLLLDSHALIWWFADSARLSRIGRDAISERREDVYVSAASVWEISIKHAIGKLPMPPALISDLDAAVRAEGFIPMNITLRHGQAAGALPGPHRDPFDRLLLAQALLEGLTLVSNEALFDQYGVERVW